MDNKFFFDYIFYRINQFYFKWDGRRGSTSIVLITLTQSIIALNIVILVLRLFMGVDQTAPYKKIGVIVGIVFFLSLVVYNYFKYSDKYNKLKTHWKSESDSLREVRGFFVLLFLTIPWVSIVLTIVFLKEKF